nr:retinal-specific atp-binding cassette transporter [Quercus suber]
MAPYTTLRNHVSNRCFLTVDMADLTVLYRNLEIIYYTIGLICPAVSLMRALMVSLNVYAISCNGSNLATNPGDINLFGGPILYLVLQTLVLIAFLVFWESGCSLEAFGIHIRSHAHKLPAKDQEKDSDAGSDAIEDFNRLSDANFGLRVEHISKTFGSNRAVNDVSFGVLPSEKFALLGPNGGGENMPSYRWIDHALTAPGKSTTISLIRGEQRPDRASNRSAIHISGDSLMQTPVAAKKHLGVCPQFDSVDTMTLSENLHFYARARGVKGKEKEENVRAIITRLGLSEHTKKLVGKLSGGTKRKLSLGIALIANPSVLLLDEPSSGMDVAAKRALWTTLQAISSGRSLLITTHSMEEADALCDRAGIMASQMLALGTIPELHARYSDKIYIQIVHKDAPRSSPEEIDALWTWVRSMFLISETEKSVGGQLRFAVPTRREPGDDTNLLDGGNMGMLYRAIQVNKYYRSIRDYSIGHATLDQVFLNVVSQHEVDEENSQPSVRKPILKRLLWR